MNWIEDIKDGVILRVVVQPQSPKNQIVGLHGDPARLKIRIAAPPREGEANDELVKYLKILLRPLHAQVSLLRGETSKKKDLFIRESSKEQIEKILNPLVFSAH